jgi:hypothetical protein
VGAEITNGRCGNLHSLGAKERPLQLQVSTIAAQFARRGHNPMTWNIGSPAVAHDVADCSRGTWPSGRFRNVTVSRDAADRNPTHDRQNELFKGIHVICRFLVLTFGFLASGSQLWFMVFWLWKT